MIDLLTALALAIILEGLLYAAFPEQMKRALAMMLEVPSSKLRMAALTFAMLGLVMLYLVRG